MPTVDIRFMARINILITMATVEVGCRSFVYVFEDRTKIRIRPYVVGSMSLFRIAGCDGQFTTTEKDTVQFLSMTFEATTHP
jgi:hypothetical protein